MSRSASRGTLAFLLALAASASAVAQAPAPLPAPAPAGEARPLVILLDRSFLDNEMRLRDRIAYGAEEAVRSCAALRPVGIVAYDKGLKVYAEPTANEGIQERAIEDALRRGDVVEGRTKFLSALREAGGPDASGVEESLSALAFALQTAFGSGDILLLGFRMDLYRVPRPHPKYLEAVGALQKAGVHVYLVDYQSNAPRSAFLDLAKETGGLAEGSNQPGAVPKNVLSAICGR
jgi:hypothetical protein